METRTQTHGTPAGRPRLVCAHDDQGTADPITGSVINISILTDHRATCVLKDISPCVEPTDDSVEHESDQTAN